MPKSRQTRASEYLQLRPYRAISAPKLRPQKERDQIAYGGRKQNRISILAKPIPSRILFLVLAFLVIALAVGFWIGLSYLKALLPLR